MAQVSEMNWLIASVSHLFSNASVQKQALLRLEVIIRSAGGNGVLSEKIGA